MLEDIDSGKEKPSTLKEGRQTKPSQPLPRPTMPEGPRSGQIKYKDYAPKDISPHGDLGMLDDKEQKAFFPKPIEGANAEWHSSKDFPIGKVRTMGDKEHYPRVDRNSPVYPQHDKGDYSGLKAGSKPAPQRRGVPANGGAINVDFKGKGMAP